MTTGDYAILYDLPEGEYEGKGIDGIRTVTWRAGRSLEVICHPIVKLSPEARREAKSRKTGKWAAEVNRRNTERHMMRLVEQNFSRAAWVVTLTYAYPVEDYGMCNLDELSAAYDALRLPWDMDRVRKDMRNFLARLKRVVKSNGGDPKGVKWLMRIEEGVEPPMGGLPPKYHLHGVIEADGLRRDDIEAAWQGVHGLTKIERLDLDNDGPMRIARYLNKQRRGGRWWSHSRNLRAPQPRVSDRKMSRRRAAKVAADLKFAAREIFEKLYPGYKLVEDTVRYSDFVAGAYIYARMRRRD